MKKITLKDDKLFKLLTEKAELITIGRAKSVEIEKIEIEQEEADKNIQENEKQVNIDDLLEEEKVLTTLVEDAIEKMNDIKKRIYERMKSHVDPELYKKYDEIKKNKDDLESERNKIALKAMKYNGKIIPLGRKLMKPFLEDIYDDYETIKIEDGEIVCSLFNHLEEFKTNFKKNAI